MSKNGLVVDEEKTCRGCDFIGSDGAYPDATWWVCDHLSWDSEYDGLGRAIGGSIMEESKRPDWCPLKVYEDFRQYATATQSYELREKVCRSLERSLIEHADVWADLAG